MIIHDTYWIIKCTDIPLSLWLTPWSITVDFAELIFTYLIGISALNPKSRHYATLATLRSVPGRRFRSLIWRNVFPLARVTLPEKKNFRGLAHLHFLCGCLPLFSAVSSLCVVVTTLCCEASSLCVLVTSLGFVVSSLCLVMWCNNFIVWCGFIVMYWGC